MAATEPSQSNDPDEYIVSSGKTSGKKKHRPASGDSTEPACDSTIRHDDREWRWKASRQTIFQDHCQKPGCFGGDH